MFCDHIDFCYAGWTSSDVGHGGRGINIHPNCRTAKPNQEGLGLRTINMANIIHVAWAPLLTAKIMVYPRHTSYSNKEGLGTRLKLSVYLYTVVVQGTLYPPSPILVIRIHTNRCDSLAPPAIYIYI